MWFSPCACKGECGCGPLCELRLPGPVADITEVKIDGRVLEPDTEYRVDDFSKLVLLGLWEPVQQGIRLAYAGLDLSAQVCVDEVPFDVEGIDLGGGCYGPVQAGPSAGILRLSFADTTTVTADYTGPAQGLTAFVLFDPDLETAPPAFAFEQADVDGWTVGETLSSIGLDLPDEGTFRAQMTLDAGTAPTFNAPRNQAIEGDFSATYAAEELNRDACFPDCQDLELDDTEEGTFSVAYVRGRGVPHLGELAMQALVCALARLCAGASDCPLPANIARLTRKGVEIQFTKGDAAEQLVEAVPEIALFLRVWNPNRLMARSRIYRPDARKGGIRVRT